MFTLTTTDRHYLLSLIARALAHPRQDAEAKRFIARALVALRLPYLEALSLLRSVLPQLPDDDRDDTDLLRRLRRPRMRLPAPTGSTGGRGA